ncbi:MAG: hypothetical protein K2X95_12680 [Flavobacteriaceae bacterium]|nr:hypothetical protein [Flavobacteriaceae bacterium]
MDKFKKIDKEFCLTDESVNVYGYRCLTSGLQLDEVKKNPIGYFMHQRDNGVVVRWEDFRVDGAKVYAKPVINLSHPEGENKANEIENGFLNAASVGRIVCLEASDDKAFKMKGQTGPTVTKWFPREISLVDIPGNYNALANLFDENDQELNLADFVKPKKENMSKIILAASVLTALNLSDNASDGDLNNAIQDLLDRANKSNELAKNLADVTAEFDAFKTTATSKEVADLVAKGIADKKLTKDLADKLSVDYSTNPVGLKSLLDAMPAQVSVVDALADKTKEALEFEGKSWDDLYAADKLETVRTKFPSLYEKLKSEKYPKKD